MAVVYQYFLPRDSGGLLTADGKRFAVRGSRWRWDWRATDYLNAEDLNRIEDNCAYLAGRLRAAGYLAELETKTDWTMADIPYREEIDRIRRNVDTLQVIFYSLPEWREIVYNNTMDFEQMNAMEWDLHLLDVWLSRMMAVYRYCGTFYCGE